jgi:hypothetical protein
MAERIAKAGGCASRYAVVTLAQRLALRAVLAFRIRGGRVSESDAVFSFAMPVTYHIDARRGLIRTRCTGFVTLPEVLDHFQTLEADPDCPRHLDVILDLRDITSLADSEKLRAVSREISRIRPTIEFGACAVVVSTEAHYGMVMVFEVFAARFFQATKIFMEMSTAEVWMEDRLSG